MIAMILAAGRGERLRPVTDSTPKALVDVGGRSLIERHLDALRAAGIEFVVINLGWLGEQVASRIGSGAEFGVSVAYSPEGDDILETGGGIHRALPLLGSAPFLVVNADVYTDMPLPTTLADDVDGHLVLVPKPAYKPRGDFDLIGDKLVCSDEPSLTFSGIAIYRPEFFVDCRAGRFPLAPMLRAAASHGRLSGEVYGGCWEDVGTPERLAGLNRRLR
jgi:MurNAc alpha-1-phosphate uridylyltransferase